MNSRGIRLLHFADAHIGVENYGRLDPATGWHSRLVDFLRTLDATVAHALDHDFDLVVFAGDAFRTRDPNPTQQREFARRIMKLAGHGIPVVLLVGNHDVPNASGRANSLELYQVLQVPNVYVGQRPGVLRIETKRGPALVAVLPHIPRSRLLSREEYRDIGVDELNLRLAGKTAQVVDELASEVRAARQGPDGDRIPAVLAAHLSVAEGRAGSERSIMVGTEMVIPASEMERPEFDYVALGHLHPYQVLGIEGKVVYAGSLDRVDFGEEGDDKGFVVVDLVRGGAEHRFVQNPVRPFVTVRARVEDDGDPTGQILAAVGETDLTGAVVRLVVEISQQRWAEVRQRELVRTLEERAFYVLPVRKEWTAAEAALRNPAITEKVDPVEALARYFSTSRRPANDLEDLLERARRLEAEIREADLGADLGLGGEGAG